MNKFQKFVDAYGWMLCLGACFTILTASVTVLPEGKARFIGLAVAAVAFPLVPLVGGFFKSAK